MGGNAGYRCEFVASAHRGPATAVMTNADEGGLVVPALLSQLARRLGWSALARHGLAGETSIDFRGTYETASGSVIALEATATGAMLTVGDQDPLRFDIVDEHTLATADGRISVTPNSDQASRAAGFTLRQCDQEIFVTRRES